MKTHDFTLPSSVGAYLVSVVSKFCMLHSILGKNTVKLKGKVAIVTGAGKGIGKAVALAFAREGAHVVVVSRTFLEIKDVAAQIGMMGRRALPLRVDVSRRGDVFKMVNSAAARFGRIDVLVNNAGVLGPVGPLVKNDVDDWIKTVEVNLIGTFFCCREVLPTMMKQHNGKIINFSGGGATSPRPRFSAYASSKTAVVRLTETLAEEVKEFNIQVNAIAPGLVDTRMHDQVLATGEAAGKKAIEESQRVKATGGTPLKLPVELAIFLASDASDGLTGKLISAMWDNWKEMDLNEVSSSDVYTLRRKT
ncbi:MAG TPA: SDR family oxidoreductase [Candidatus Bathyarchaeia archaeon]|nr:SDR family oxidoreductase [Candidatus Bathyarchaeia archaeon]